jgi:uncharacterized protein (TIGR03083 family)
MDATEILHDACVGVEVLAERLAEILHGVPTGAAAVSPEWSIRDAVAHLVSGTVLYAELAAGASSPVDDVSPHGFRVFNAQRLADIADIEPAQLAKSLSGAVAQFLGATDRRSADTIVRWHGGLELDLAQLSCVLLGEYVLHGYDVAAAVGAPWPIDPGHAALTLYGYGPLLPVCVDPSTSGGHTAGYELDVGAAGRLAVRFVAGAITVGPADERPRDDGPVDCTITADPTAFLLVMSGRMPQATAISLGLLRASGPRPELGVGFGGLFRYP